MPRPLPRPLKPTPFFKPHTSLLLLALLVAQTNPYTTFPYEPVSLADFTIAGGVIASLIFPLVMLALPLIIFLGFLKMLFRALRGD